MSGAGFKPWLKNTKAAEAAAAASQSSHMPQPAISAIYTDLRDPQGLSPHSPRLSWLSWGWQIFLSARKIFNTMAVNGCGQLGIFLYFSSSSISLLAYIFLV